MKTDGQKWTRNVHPRQEIIIQDTSYGKETSLKIKVGFVILFLIFVSELTTNKNKWYGADHH